MVNGINNTQLAYSPPDTANEKKSDGQQGESDFSFWGEDGLTFWDFVDVINPLQHIPVVSTAYRSLTGDEIDPGARLAGGTVFGGPIGLAASAFNVILEHNTGKDAGEHVLAWFDGEEEPVEEGTTYAQQGQNPNVASFAPLPAEIPETEMDAFAAGEASLRLAELQQFMNPALAKEVPVAPQATVQGEKASGSIGTWSQPHDMEHPFPTERPLNAKPAEVSSLYQPVKQAQTTAQPETVANTIQYQGFKAKQSHEESLDALAAFARDVKAQQMQTQAQDVTKPATGVAAPNPAQLSQTNDNAWFANMMSQNLNRYQNREPKG